MKRLVGAEQALSSYPVTESEAKLTWVTEQETLDRRRFLETAGVRISGGRISLITRDTYRKQKHQRMSYADLERMANRSIRSHRLEQQVVVALRSLGFTADVLPIVYDGDLSKKAADIIITAENGQQFSLEVKQNRSSDRKYNLGLPVNREDFGGVREGYKSYPRSLLIDSCHAWDSKVNAADDANIPLVGAVIACNIGRLSTEDDSCLGLILVPTDSMADWSETWVNYRHGYYAYEAPNHCLYALSALDDVLALEQQRLAEP